MVCPLELFKTVMRLYGAELISAKQMPSPLFEVELPSRWMETVKQMDQKT
jgi:hypothetical protein